MSLSPPRAGIDSTAVSVALANDVALSAASSASSCCPLLFFATPFTAAAALAIAALLAISFCFLMSSLLVFRLVIPPASRSFASTDDISSSASVAIAWSFSPSWCSWSTICSTSTVLAVPVFPAVTAIASATALLVGPSGLASVLLAVMSLPVRMLSGMSPSSSSSKSLALFSADSSLLPVSTSALERLSRRFISCGSSVAVSRVIVSILLGWKSATMSPVSRLIKITCSIPAMSINIWRASSRYLSKAAWVISPFSSISSGSSSILRSVGSSSPASALCSARGAWSGSIATNIADSGSWRMSDSRLFQASL